MRSSTGRAQGGTTSGGLDERAGLLRRVWHFRHLKTSDLLRIIQSGSFRRFAADAVICEEAAPCAGMFVLLRGRVALAKLGPNGQRQILAAIDPVIMFNEIAVIDGGPNPYSALALQRCLTWNISHEGFVGLVHRYPDPEIGLGLLRVLAARTRLLINRCDDISFRPVMARTAKLLLDLSDSGRRVIDRSGWPIEDLAAHIASVPETISRSLNVLDEMGLIRHDRRTIEVLAPRRLAEVAQA